MKLNDTILLDSVKENALHLLQKYLTDDDIPTICKFLELNPEIHTLDLSFNKLSPKGIKILAENIKLEKLYLAGNVVGDEGAEALKENTSLQKCYLDCTTIDNARIAYKILPDALERNEQRASQKNARLNLFRQKINATGDDKMREIFNIGFNFK